MTCGLNTLKDAFLEIKNILVEKEGFKEDKAFRTAQRLMSAEAGITFTLSSGGLGIKSVSYKKDGKNTEVKEFSWSESDNGFEVSTRGSELGKKFSALNAKFKDGETVELKWAKAKGYNTIKEAKNKPAKDNNFKYWETYLGIWRDWAKENLNLIEALREASKGKQLTDRFAKTDNNQAGALTEILKETEARDIEKDSNTNKEPDNGEKFMDKFQKVFKDAKEMNAFNANYTHLEVNINGLIKFKGRKDSKEVKTYEEFKQISEELNSILLHTQKETIKDYSGTEAEKLIDGFYKMLSGSGIKFRPFELKLVAKLDEKDLEQKSVESLGMGVHTVRGGKNGKPLIKIPSKRLFRDIYLPKVLLHEYAHAITVEGMRGDKGEEFNKRAVKLREHVIKELKNKGKTDEYINGIYGLSGDSKITGYEFIAEAMTSPQLQKILVDIKSSSQNSNALEDIRNLFKAIMNYVYKNTENNMQTALDEALDIVIEIQVSEGRLDRQEASQADSLESQSFNTEDSGLDIIESFSVLKKDDIEGFKDIMSKNKKECGL